MIYAGHTGISTDGGITIYGFNPDGAGVPVWQLMDGLKNGDAFPGAVRADTAMFAAAKNHGLAVLSFDVILPDPQFQGFKTILDGERRKSQYTYGFPNGDGDCNCTTWPERLGLPLLTGRMDEFVRLPGISSLPSRRFGRCVQRGVTTMHYFPPPLSQDEEHLGELAMKFRGARRDEERRAIAGDYSQTGQQLIDGGCWREMPAPEDQLPDAGMPTAFFDYWSHR
jgi:hypothetical protein